MSLSKISAANHRFLRLLSGFLYLIIFVNTLYSKDVKIEAIVGAHIVIEDTLAANFQEPVDTVIINGLVQVSNPTLFFIDSVVPKLPDVNYKYERIENHSNNNSNYSYLLKIYLESKITAIKIRTRFYGEILAGNDSICSLDFKFTKLNGIPMEELNVKIAVENIGGPLPYLRFPYLRESRYNENNRNITWEYWFDQDSDVELTMYDIGGRARLLESYRNKRKGTYNFTFTPDYTTTAGLYFLMLTTNTGYAVRPFMVSN